MDFDSFFGSGRWKILEILAREPSSPLELSEKLSTSVSYISQQLKLLEAGNFVVKERTGMAEKGKPRMVFSLASELLYLTALLKNSPAKKILYLTDYHKLILKIWLLENSTTHHIIEKLYWFLEPNFDSISAICVEDSMSQPRVFVVSDSKSIRSKLDTFAKEHVSVVRYDLISVAHIGKISRDQLTVLHDPSLLFTEQRMKGGNSN